jgi:hypothetical protein
MGEPPESTPWTALRWQGFFDCVGNAGWCGHVSDLLARHIAPLALMVLLQIDWQTRLADMAVRRCRLYGAASTAFQTAGALRSLRNSLSRLNCLLWIRRNSSMPAIVIAAVLNHLNPSIGSMRSFTPR